MKKLLLFSLLIPGLALAQTKLNRGTAYIGIMLHEDQIGGSVLLSYSAHKFIGIGAGVDISSYNEELIVPFYADLAFKYPINKFTPFINGQFGKHLYRKKDVIVYTDLNGNRTGSDDEIGRYFYGAGAGLEYKLGKAGIFVRYTYRDYKFKQEGKSTENAQFKLETSMGINVITFGIAF